VKRSIFVLIEIGILVGLLVSLLVSPPSIPWLIRLITCIAVFVVANAFLIFKLRQTRTQVNALAKDPKPRLYLVFILLGFYWLACFLLRLIAK
jgi:Trk-type K+ transport system membrane component